MSPGKIRIKALFDKECKWRLIEEFGTGCFDELPDGKLLFHADYTNRENLISWILTFGEKALLLEPECLRKELGEIIQKMAALYEGNTENEGSDSC